MKLNATIPPLVKELKGDHVIWDIINKLLITRYNWSFNLMAQDIAKIIGTNLYDIVSENQLREFEKAHIDEVNGFELYSDSIDFIEELKNMNMKTALASNATEFYTQISRKVLGLDKILDALYLTCELWKGKFDKSFYEMVLWLEGIKAEQAIMIWDNVKADVFAAKDAWLEAIHLDRQSESATTDEFSKYLATESSNDQSKYPKASNLEDALKIIKDRK